MVDFLLIIFCLFCLTRGIFRGPVIEAISIAGIIFGLMVASAYYVWKLMCVLRPYAEHKERFDFRVFRSSSAQIAQVGVTSYDSLDAYPKLIIYHGWYDKFSNLIEIIKGGGLLAA